jgi:hypothetical protein
MHPPHVTMLGLITMLSVAAYTTTPNRPHIQLSANSSASLKGKFQKVDLTKLPQPKHSGLHKIIGLYSNKHDRWP